MLMEHRYQSGFPDTATRERIEASLADIERVEGVRVLFAVESGSRAWGFASPDSDYDVRFVYVHAPDWYLSVRPGRDVIERPISEELDICGWDLRKALALLLKPNPALVEWLASPIRYRWEAEFADPLTRLAGNTAFGTPLRFHYINYAETKWREHIADRSEVVLKRYFYVLRPALCLRWLGRGRRDPPPMNLLDLMEGVDLTTEECGEIVQLVATKASMPEIGTVRRNPVLDALIAREIDAAHAVRTSQKKVTLISEADALFRRTVHGLAPRAARLSS